MAIDSHYIPAFSIEDVLLDRDTGAPLSGGKVYFEQDNQRGILKTVYQITGTSPNYTFVPLPNPVILSSIGTFEDALGNPVIPYFYPYDAELNPEYYYIRVLSSGDVPQFTREAQPYIAEESDDVVLSAITNEISNPQFALVNFDTSAGAYTYSVNTVTNTILNLAPDWFLVVSAPGAGTVTVNQLKPTGSLNVPTNPATIMNISSAGLSKLQLVTRLYGSPNLWGSGFLSASFVAKTYSGTPVVLNMYYSQSNGTVIDQQFLPAATLPTSGNYEQFNGTVEIPISNSANTFPTAYIDIYFDIPLGVQIDITSIMVAFSGENAIPELQYDQESVSRQIDHLYHYAYPIVPVGTVIDYAGFGVPEHYLPANGVTGYSRVTYYKLFEALTTLETVTLTNGVATFTATNVANYFIGMHIEGTGVQAATTISNIVGTTVTMSAVATASIASSVRFFLAGAGDGSTTFNTPDLRDYVIAGSDGSLFGAGRTAPGYKGGANTVTLVANNLPAHTHNPAAGAVDYLMGGAAGATPFAASAGAVYSHFAATGVNTTTNSAVSIVQKTALLRKFIRYQ